MANFRSDFQVQYQFVEVTDGLADRAMTLAEKHSLRGYDAVQLAAALGLHAVRNMMELPPLIFVSADSDLNRAAQAEGLIVDDPNDHPLVCLSSPRTTSISLSCKRSPSSTVRI